MTPEKQKIRICFFAVLEQRVQWWCLQGENLYRRPFV